MQFIEIFVDCCRLLATTKISILLLLKDLTSSTKILAVTKNNFF